MSALTCISAAKRQLAKAVSINDVLEIRDKAEAVRVYIKAAGESLDAQIAAADIRLRAERRAGELLAQMVIHGGDRKSKSKSHDVTLKDLGITRMQSSRWQLAAKLPEGDYEAIVASCRDGKRELTQTAVLSAARKMDPQPPVQQFQSAKLDAFELVGELRMCIRDFAERFGPERADIMRNVLRAEVAALEPEPASALECEPDTQGLLF